MDTILKMIKRKSAESGQAILEYIMLLAIIVPIVFYALRMMKTGSDQGTAKLGGRLEKQLRTSDTPINIWSK